jgi:hypothetical protein
LQSWPTEINEWFVIPGKTCAMDEALLNSGMSMDSVCIDSIVAPFGRRTVKGLSDLILFFTGLVDQKVMVCASRAYNGCLMLLQKWWGTTVFKLCYYLKLPPRHIIPCQPDCRPCCRP